MRISRNQWIGLALAILAFGLAPAAHAQYPGYLTNSNDTGLPSYGSFISSNVDNVNLGNGGLTIRIPIDSNSGRGKSDTLYWQFDSKFWTVIPFVIPSYTTSPTVNYTWTVDNTAGWQPRSTGNEGQVGGFTNWNETTFSCDMPPQGGGAGAEVVYEFGPATVLIRSNFVYMSPDGSKHQVPLRGSIQQLYPGYCPNYNNGQLPSNFVAQSDNDMDTNSDITAGTLFHPEWRGHI